MHFDMVQYKAVEIEFFSRPHTRELLFNVNAIVFKQQAVELPQWVVAEVQTGVVCKVWCTQKGASWVVLRRSRAVGPAVDRAYDVAGALCTQVPAAFEHDGLAVAADVGNKLNAMRVAHQRPTMAFLGQGVVVADFGNR